MRPTELLMHEHQVIERVLGCLEKMADLAESQQPLDPALAGLAGQQAYLADIARKRGDELLDAHKRVRRATKTTGISQRIEPKLPVDVLGAYVYLPTVVE